MTTTTEHPATNGDVAPGDRLPKSSQRSAPSVMVPQTSPPPVDRVGAIWHGKHWIILAGVIAALLTLVATLFVPKTYSSSVQVIMNASPVSGSSVADLVVASNNLAAQYAQLVTSDAVVTPAAEAAGSTTAALSSRTKSSTLAGQNIVSITVQATKPDQAQTEADALGVSLVKVIAEQGSKRSQDYSESVVAQLAPLDAQIAKARKSVDDISAQLAKTSKSTVPQAVSAASARLGSAQSLLSSLSERRANLATQATLQAISLAPQAQLLGAASAPIRVEPRPALYSLVAGILGLVIGAQIVIVVADRRRRRLPSIDGQGSGAAEPPADGAAPLLRWTRTSRDRIQDWS